MTTHNDTHTHHSRVGFADPVEVLAQRDYRIPYGYGGKLISAIGCPLVALCNARSAAGSPLDVAALNDACRRARPPVWAPGASAAMLPRMARVAGFECPDASVTTEAIGCEEASFDITLAIERGGFAWIGVDKNADRSVDHWVMAHAFDDTSIHYMDSATGDVGTLDRRTLSGVSTWAGKVKQYQAVRFYSLALASE